MIVVDTTACIDFLGGQELVKARIQAQTELLAITSISIYVVNIGLERTKRKISESRHQELYQKWLEFLSSLQAFPLDTQAAEKSAQIYDALEAKGSRIDDNDCLIAGIMVSNGIKKILTRNMDHFNRIEGIEIISY